VKEMKPGIDELIPNLELAIEMARVHGKPMIYIVGRHETGGKGVADFEADPFLADLKALASAEAWRARAERAEAIIDEVHRMGAQVEHCNAELISNHPACPACVETGRQIVALTTQYFAAARPSDASGKEPGGVGKTERNTKE